MTSTRRRKSSALAHLAAAGAAALALAGCPRGAPGGPGPGRVVVSCALDRLFAEPVLRDFTARTGIEVDARWDAEATKTTGLVEALRAERDRPRCDVFWNNELGQTVVLAREGLLEPWDSPAAADLPAWARDPERRWTGFAARGRVLIVNAELVPEAEQPRSVDDLLDPRWRGRCAIAKPLFGTTATHAAAWLAQRGPEGLSAFLRGLVANEVVVCAGNATVKDKVAAGELAWGLTDTDDVHLAMLAGKPVRCVFPDQGDGPGSFLIPNSIALVRGGPNPAAGRALIDFVLAREVEAALAASRSAQIPLRPGVPRPAWIPADVKVLPVDWPAIGAAFPEAARLVRRDLLGE